MVFLLESNLVLKDRKLSLGTTCKVLECYVMSTLMYGSECWTISSEMEKKLEAMEMWCYRRMLKLSWTKKVTNEEVLKRVGKGRTIMKRIRNTQLEVLRHIMRKEKLENLTVTGETEGKRSRG